jgi:hypothetical protein
LQELSAIFSIDEKSLFQDIYGFSMVNDVNHPIYEKTAEEYLLEGNQDYQKNKFQFCCLLWFINAGFKSMAFFKALIAFSNLFNLG